ncbi:MAG: hypothetical protein AAFY71_07540 [Bacteroidota bacterium]
MFNRHVFFCGILILGFLSVIEVQGQVAIPFNEGVNTEYEEREPVPSPEGNTLYFWRRKDPRNVGGVTDPGDIWYTQRRFGDRWSTAKPMGSSFNTSGQEFIWQISEGSDTLWMVQNIRGAGGSGAGYVTRSFTGYWERIQPIRIRGFEFFGTYKDFTFSDERVMILTNRGRETNGGSDLYISFPLNDTAWTKPANMGDVINTSMDEDAPFLSRDGKTLYFNSNGHGGEGDHDIWVSYRLDDSWANWSKPVNMGPPINSDAYDFDFVTSYDGKWGFWASGREGGQGDYDLYRVNLEKCQVDVFPQGDQVVCANDDFVLEAGFVPGRNIRYQWLKNGSPIRGAFQRSFKVVDEGNYQLIRDTGSCRDTSKIQKITFSEPPSVKIITTDEILCVDDSIRLRADSRSAIRYQWYYNGLELPEKTRFVLQAQRPGIYSVEAFDGNCSMESDPVEVKRFDDPEIYLAKDTVLGRGRPLPRWLWTNKVPQTKSRSRVLDLAISDNGSSYMLVGHQKGGREQLSVKKFSPEGLYKGKFQSILVPGTSAGFIDASPDGNIIVADEDRFLAKYKPDGTVLWSKERSMPDLLGMQVDPIGNIYVAAEFRDSLYFGPKVYAASGRGSIFLAKFSPRGEMLWIQTFFLDVLRADYGNCLQVDGQGNVYFLHGFRIAANYRQEILRASLAGNTYGLVKFSPKGKLKWATKLVAPKIKPRVVGFYTDESGSSFVAAHDKLWNVDAAGNQRWKDDLLYPKGHQVIRLDMAGGKGDIYISGLTDKKEYFITKLNRLNRQAIIWSGKKALQSKGDFPAIQAGPKGAIYAAGVTKGKSFPGIQFDKTSNNKAFLIKYGQPDGKFQRDPIIMCKGDRKTLVTVREAGLRYQWYYNGNPVKNGNNYYLEISKTGTYQVQAKSELCDRISAPRMVTPCDEDPMKNPIAKVVKEKEEDLPPATPSAPPIPEKTTPKSTDVSYAPSGKPKKVKNRRVKTQKGLTIEGSKASIYLWDHGALDRDTISVNINGEWLVENYPLTKERVEIPFQFKKGDNYIVLYALNLGTIPPNTASIMVDDGRTKQTLQLRSTLKTSGMLRVRVKD